jgi:hypothetical protein
MLTPHVTSMSGLPSAHACEQEHTAPGSYSHSNGDHATTGVTRQDSLIGDSGAPAEYFRRAEPEAD